MARPVPLDNDAFATRLRRLISQVDEVANRAVVTVGKAWRVEQERGSGDLVAVIGKRRLVLAAAVEQEPGEAPEEVRPGGWLSGVVRSVAADGKLTVQLSSSGELVAGLLHLGWTEALTVGDVVVALPPGDSSGSYQSVYMVLGPLAPPAGPPPPPGPRVFSSTGPVSIPDDPGSGYGSYPVASPIVVTGIPGSAPSALLVTINITHTYPRDLRVWLSPPGAPPYPDDYDPAPPSNAVFLLYNGATGGPLPQYTVDASAWPANGTWELWVADVAHVDVGTITSWSLTFP